MHVADSVAEAAYGVDLVVTACHDVAEVQHGADRRLTECLVQHFGPVEVGAQPPRVWRLHEQVQSRGADDLGGRGEASRHRRNVAVTARFAARCPAGRRAA